MLEAFGLSDPGCVRQNNEDFFLLSPTKACLSADGMGGAQAGEHASKMAVETVASFIQNMPVQPTRKPWLRLFTRPTSA